MFTNWKKHLVALGVMGAIIALGSIAVPHKVWAQAKAALVRDVDQPARGAFQTSVDLNVSGGSSTGITIPAGYRLVVDYVAMDGGAQSIGGGIQPYVLLTTTVGSRPAVIYYLTPTQSNTAPLQFQHSEPVTIYGDTLGVGLAYSGYAPSYLILNVPISGYLISML